MRTVIQKSTLDRLRQQVKQFRDASTSQRKRIKELTYQLETEQEINRAMSRLSFAKHQPADVLAEAIKAIMRRETA